MIKDLKEKTPKGGKSKKSKKDKGNQGKSKASKSKPSKKEKVPRKPKATANATAADAEPAVEPSKGPKRRRKAAWAHMQDWRMTRFFMGPKSNRINRDGMSGHIFFI